MDPREHLQSMLTNLINGNEQDASASVHQYIVAKSREIASARGDNTNVVETDNDDE